MPITLLDGILVGFTLVSAMLAMVRGFSREILSIASWAAAAAAFGSDAPGASAVETLVSLVLICPAISVAVRRLHDLDRSGWWFWIVLIPLVGWIILLVWDCTRGTPGPNRFGPENGLL